MVICLERGADLHMAHLMPLPLTVSCFSKIQIGFTFLVPAHPGSPGQRAVKWVCAVEGTVKWPRCIHAMRLYTDPYSRRARACWAYAVRAVQKRLNRSRCCLEGWGRLAWAQRTLCLIGGSMQTPWQGAF